jgi:hypothetical protein
MATGAFMSETLRSLCERGRWSVVVPWKRADELHARLQRQGCVSTLCLDPVSREARLELPPGGDPEQLLEKLRAAASPMRLPVPAAS